MNEIRDAPPPRDLPYVLVAISAVVPLLAPECPCSLVKLIFCCFDNTILFRFGRGSGLCAEIFLAKR
jgi:hypothetical protein